MTPADGTLSELVAGLENQARAARRSGEPVAILDAATAAIDAIEPLAGDGSNEEQRRALSAAQRITFNAAADCWPGWSVTAPAVDEPTLVRALELSRRSARLVEQLGLGGVQQGTAAWLSGAFELALGRLAEASASFAVAHRHYAAAGAPGLVLLTQGYSAIVERLAPASGADGGKGFEQVCAEIAAGGFEDGAAWIEQLRTALQVFAR